MPTWTQVIFDHGGRTVSRLETASGLVLAPGRGRIDIHLAPVDGSRIAVIRHGSLSIGDLHVEAVRGLHDAVVFGAWSDRDAASVAGAAWPSNHAATDVLAQLASLLASSQIATHAPGSGRLVETAARLHRRAARLAQ